MGLVQNSIIVQRFLPMNCLREGDYKKETIQETARQARPENLYEKCCLFLVCIQLRALLLIGQYPIDLLDEHEFAINSF